MSDIEYDRPANWLRHWRKQRRLTQAGLAERVGVDQSTVGKWERGEHTLINHLEKLAGILDVPPERLLFGPDAVAHTALPPGAPAFSEDATPFSGGMPGIHLKLGDTEIPYRIRTDAVSRARGGNRLLPADVAIFDIGAETMRRFQRGEWPDGTVVIAQAHDDESGTAKTMVRQWLGDVPGLLLTNRPDHNTVINLQQHGEVSVMGVLSRSLRHHAVRPPDPGS